MSDQAVKSDNGKDEIPEKCHPCQSVWMSHWKHPSYRSVDDIQNQSSVHFESGEDRNRAKQQALLGEPDIERESSKFVKEFRKMRRAFMNESTATSSKKLRHETFKGQHFPMLRYSQNGAGVLSLKNVESSSHYEGALSSQIGPTSGCDFPLGGTDNCLPSMLDCTPSKTEIQPIEYHFEPEGIMSNPEQQVKANKLLEKNVKDFSAPLKDELLGSTSRVLPSQFNRVRTPTESLVHREDYVDQPSSNIFIDQKKMNSNAALLIHSPSTSDNRPRVLVGEHIQKMPNQIRPPDIRLYNGSHEPPGIPSSVHDVKTMRIYTNIDSVKEFIGGPSKFSQTTHHFLFTQKTDVNLSDGGQIFRESTIATKIEGNPMSELLSLSPDFGLNIKHGVKLQTLDICKDSERKDRIENDHTSGIDLKNESSAKTDTMDMDTLRENHLSGVDSFVLKNKDIEGAQKSPTTHAAIASDREESRSILPNVELPEVNQERPVVSGVANSDDTDTGTSRTQSLDAEHLLSHADHSINLKSNACADGPLGLDPYSRWVERLKPSGLESFGHGTKSSKMEEATSHEKVNKLFCKMPNCGKTSSAPKMNRSYHKEQMVMDSAELLRNAESSSADSMRKRQDIKLSHSWIRRWCHKPASSSKKKSEAVVICEPQSSKATVDNFQKQQFPSIAAMALMGKAMTGFRPCEFNKRGSFIVWNTKGF